MPAPSPTPHPAACYHCGQPVPGTVDLAVEIAGAPRAMCCAGCQAVARAIVDQGLDDYYRSRDALPVSGREPLPAVLEQAELFDHADFQKRFVTARGPDEREASLILEGITCAACIWLNEQHLARLPGITAVSINYATRRARVRWDESRLRLSDILRAVAAIGYRAYPYDASRHEKISRRERRDALWRLWVAGFGMMQVMMYAFPAYVADGEMTWDIEQLMRWASLLLTLPVVAYSASPFFRHAWRDLCRRRVGMDVPVALGVGTAFAASCWATVIGQGEVYFDSVTMFVFFLLGGRYLEMAARQKALGVTETLARLLPAMAKKMPDFPVDRGCLPVLVADLAPGDHVLVGAGDTIPADGTVIEGQSATSEALLTGESRPLAKRRGDPVIGGAVNQDSPLIIRVEQVGEATRLSGIVRLMERAAQEKPRLAELADRVAAVFVTVLLVVAAAVAGTWWHLDPDRALWVTVSVLVVTCPCALSLATPVALTVAAGALARDGLLVTRGHAIETLARATHVVFDKTGTLTTGNMQLLACHPVSGREDSALAVAAALEQGSRHPVAAALGAACSCPVPAAGDLRADTGQGVAGVVDGVHYRLGRPEYAAPGVSPPAGWADSGDTVVCLAAQDEPVAWFRLGDPLRDDAAPLVAALHQAGVGITLLTGDAAPVARRVAETLGIRHWHATQSPADKHRQVTALQAAGEIVAMVGDGVNDAPVLACAQVSVAMGGGTELARAQSDLVLLSENLTPLRRGHARARKTLRIIRQNLGWSFAYNFIALPLAMAGYVTPWMAGIGMSASSLLVVLNALRIQRLEDPA